MSEVHGVGAYIRAIQKRVHRSPARAAKLASDHKLSHVLIMGAWQQPNKSGKVTIRVPNRKSLVAYADAFRQKDVKIGLWYYPWAGYEDAMIEVLDELCGLTQIDMLSNDAELGYKWRKNLSKAQIARQFGTNMRSIQPEAIRGVVSKNTNVYVKACARKLVTGIDALIAKYEMEWGHWQTSYGIAKFHPNFPWDVFSVAADVTSPQLYTATAAQVDLGIRSWYKKSEDPNHLKPVLPSIGTYGKNSGDKMHAHLSSFVDGEEDIDGFTAWSWMQTNSLEWDVLARWADWLEMGLCRRG